MGTTASFMTETRIGALLIIVGVALATVGIFVFIASNQRLAPITCCALMVVGILLLVVASFVSITISALAITLVVSAGAITGVIIAIVWLFYENRQK